MIREESVEQIILALNNVAAALNDAAIAANTASSKKEMVSKGTKTGGSKKEKDDSIGSVLGGKIATAIGTGMSMYTAKLAGDAKEVYDQIHASPFKKTKEFAVEGLKAGTRYDDAFLKKMHHRYTRIGESTSRLDERMTSMFGITGEAGASIKRGMREGVNILKNPGSAWNTITGGISSLWDDLAGAKNRNKVLNNNKRQTE